jgi:hypothetical protein
MAQCPTCRAPTRSVSICHRTAVFSPVVDTWAFVYPTSVTPEELPEIYPRYVEPGMRWTYLDNDSADALVPLRTELQAAK